MGKCPRQGRDLAVRGWTDDGLGVDFIPPELYDILYFSAIYMTFRRWQRSTDLRWAAG